MRKFSLFFLLLAAVPASSRAELGIGATNRKYPEVRSFLQRLAAENKGNVSLISIGQSDAKEDILGVRIGGGPVANLVVAAHHGNEYSSAELALAFAESLAKSPIPGQTLFIVPVLNVAGYNSRSREERNASGRSYDPNRNYPCPCGTEGPFTLKSTRAIAELVAREKIVASATLHSFYPAVVYPWGFSTRDTATSHPEEFHRLVSDATEFSRYQIGNSGEVIYPANGTFEDWAFEEHGVWSLLFELGTSHSPGEGAIQDMIRTNLPGLRKMFENAPRARAANHRFTGRCDARLQALDRHDE